MCIGCSGITTEGSFVWSNKTQPLTFTVWELDQPDDYQTGEDCCVMRWHLSDLGNWNDAHCTLLSARKSIFNCTTHSFKLLDDMFL